MSLKQQSESIEMYLKAIAELGGDRELVPISQLSKRLGFSVVSANEMVKRLMDQGLIDREMYRGVRLTGEGRHVANRVIRRQRLWECFLVERLGIDSSRAFDMACELEHATSEELDRALDRFLGTPSSCPHGNPIPRDDGTVSGEVGVALSTIAAGGKVRVASLAPSSSTIISYLEERGIRPGVAVEVTELAPLDGTLTLMVEGEEVIVGRSLAELAMVIEES